MVPTWWPWASTRWSAWWSDRPTTPAAAFELAVQHYAYCPALMDNLVPAIGALAATLFGRHWLFDWH